MPEDGEDRPGRLLRIAAGVVLDLNEVSWRFSTAGGPGGQHANTAHTRAEATIDLAGSPSLPGWARERLVERLGESLIVVAGERRSQAQNRQLALERLAARLARALEIQRPRRPTRPTEMSQRRRVQAKRIRGDLKRQRQGSAGWD